MHPQRTVARATDKETFRGRLVDLLNPSLDDIDFVDIARGLAQSTRFTGATWSPYTVAQHSVIVANLLPERLRIHGLLHDAPEVYIGDITSPLKRSLEKKLPGFRAALDAIEAPFLELIYQKAGVAMPTTEEGELVLRADLTALAIEQRDLMISDNDWRLPYPAPQNRQPIKPVGYGAAFAMFTDALREVGVEV